MMAHRIKACRLVLAAALFAGLGLATHTAAQERSYLVDLNSNTVKELESLGGGRTVARAINDAGQVAGYSYTSAGNVHAFITGPDGVSIRDLGTLIGTYSFAHGINTAGEVAGYSDTPGGASRAFITGSDGAGMRDLGQSVERTALRLTLPPGGGWRDIRKHPQALHMLSSPEPRAPACGTSERWAGPIAMPTT
jgi:probable HAF family extracellular repeat protein